MSMIMECETGTTKQRWMLRSGQRACVGRSAWVEFQVDDASLAEEHFVIDTSVNRIECVAGTPELQVDGRSLQQFAFTSNTEFRAGSSRFRIELSPHCNRVDTRRDNGDVEPAANRLRKEWKEKARVLAHEKLHPAARTIIEGAEDWSDALVMLGDAELHADAVRCAALSLNSAHTKIRWCAATLGGESAVAASPSQTSFDVVSLVHSWVEQPNDEKLAAVQRMSDSSDRSRPEAWLLQAVVWSSGAVKSGDNQPVPLPPGIVDSAVITALQLAASKGDARRLREYAVVMAREFLDKQDREQEQTKPSEHAKETLRPDVMKDLEVIDACGCAADRHA
ncbi:MAG: hypothetical protein U0892_14330 [Pirellulales bacterium]